MAGRNNKKRDSRLSDYEQGVGASPGTLGKSSIGDLGQLKAPILVALAMIIYKIQNDN